MRIVANTKSSTNANVLTVLFDSPIEVALLCRCSATWYDSDVHRVALRDNWIAWMWFAFAFYEKPSIFSGMTVIVHVRRSVLCRDPVIAIVVQRIDVINAFRMG